MHDPDVQREMQIDAEREEAWVQDQLDRLWAAYGSECPWTSAKSSSEEKDMGETYVSTQDFSFAEQAAWEVAEKRGLSMTAADLRAMIDAAIEAYEDVRDRGEAEEEWRL